MRDWNLRKLQGVEIGWRSTLHPLALARSEPPRGVREVSRGLSQRDRMVRRRQRIERHGKWPESASSGPEWAE